MYIERIALKGFKSFGEHVEILLSRKLTVIAGPNGSGKSNILDAVRWVLGEQSPTRLRISKQSDLLFQGSPSWPPAKEAWVSFVAKHDGKSRIFKRILDENGSTFIVDGKKIRLYEMEEEKRLLGLEGIDFAFISQGEVLEVINQRPNDRRENLELLFGIASYRKKREEALLKLVGVDEEARRLKTLIDELKLRRNDIHPQVLKATRKKELQDSLENITKRMKELEYAKILRDLEVHIAHKTEINRKCSAAELWVLLWERALNFFEEKVKALEIKYKENKENLLNLSAEVRNLKKKLSSLSLERKSTKDLYLRLKKEIDVARRSMQKLESEKGKLEFVIEDLSSELNARKRQYSELGSMINEQISKIKELAITKEKLLEKKAYHEAAALELKRKIRFMGKSYGDLVAQRLNIQKELLKYEETLKEIDFHLHVEEKAFEDLSSERSKAFAQVQNLASELQFRRKEEIKLSSDIERIKDMLASGAYPRPVEFLLAAKRLGKLNVDFKAFVDVISCPKEYIVALQSFLGGRQFWILVHDEDSAHKCIDYIKKANVGRATFLPLNRANPRSKALNFSPNGTDVIGWLIELIDYDAKWEKGVMHLLGNLLLVRDYERGAQISRTHKAFPVVTLEGEVFLPSGTISGGGVVEPSKNVLDLKNSLREKINAIKTLRGEIKQLNLALTREEKREISLKDETQAKLDLVNSLKGKREKTMTLLESDSEKIAGLDVEISKLKKEIRECISRLSEHNLGLQKAISEIAEMKELDLNDKLQDDLSVLTREIEVMQERIKGRQDVLKKVQEELSSIEDYISTRQKEAIKAENLITDYSFKISKEASVYKNLWHEQRMLEEEIKALEKEREKAGKLARKISSKRERAKDRYKRLEVESSLLEEKLKNLFEQKAKLEENDGSEIKEVSCVDDDEIKSLKTKTKKIQHELAQFFDVDNGVLSEDASLAARISYLSEQHNDVCVAKKELESMIEDTDRQAGILFEEALSAINRRFNAIFVRLFGGGEAHLAMSDEFDLWNSGVDISARPPGKRPQSLAQLSGGERSLTAIAYLFSTMEEALVPVAILDEVDASLDEANLRRFAELVEEYSQNIQIVAITHRRLTMEKADIMYGVTLEEPGLSKVIGVKLSEWE